MENLRRQEYLCYCPFLKKQIRHARRVSEVLRPLFPGYIFVRKDNKLQQWSPISSTFGVRKIVMSGNFPSLVAGSLIDGLKAREVDGAIARPATPYRIGQDVKIAGGPLDGLIARIIAIDERSRITLLMTFLNHSVKVSTEPHGIRNVVLH